MRSTASVEPRALTSWRVLVAVVVVTLVIVAAGTIAVRDQIRSRILDGAVDGAAILSSVIVDRTVTLTDVTQGMSAINRAELNADVILLKRRGDLVDLTIWSVPDRRLVYSSTPDDAGLPPEVIARAARDGEPFAASGSQGAEHGDAIVVYYPYDANGDGTVDALAEVVLPRQEVEGSITRSTRLLYIASAIVLAVVIAGILQVRRRQLEQDHAAVHDSLTGLGNRILLRRAARRTLAEATRDRPAALMVLDLDDFKIVNDSLGHHVGDELLVAIAHRIRDEAAPTGVAVRLGGDEFAVLMPDVPDAGRGREIASRIRDVVRRPVEVAGRQMEIDVSIGLARAPIDGTTLGDVLRCADMAMYWAKHSSDRVAEYAQIAGVMKNQAVVTKTPQWSDAWARNELELSYQPVRRADASIATVDASPIWRHPERGLLTAPDFVPALARTPFSSALDGWVLLEATRQCAEWRASGLDVGVSVSISYRSLLDESFVGLVYDALDEAGLPLPALELGVSEEVVVREPARTLPALRRLRDADVRVGLTGVGASYGATTILAEAPVTGVTIDERYGADVVTHPIAATVVAGWVHIAHKRDVPTVARGANAPDVVRRLFDLGCDAVQGTAIAPPMSADELAAWLTDTGAARVGSPPGRGAP